MDSEGQQNSSPDELGAGRQRGPQKTYELSVRVDEPDGTKNYYAAGNVLQSAPTIGLKATEGLKKAVAQAETGSWVNLAARLPRERER